MTFANALPAWALAALMGCAVALAVLSYRSARGVLDPVRLWSLVALRTLVFLLVAAIWMRPVRVEPLPEKAGTLAVLVDVSESMSLPDEGGRTRLDRTVAALDTQVLPALKHVFVPEVFGFGERLAPLDLRAARAEGRESRLGAALDALAQRGRERPLAGVVVFTDGAVDVGDLAEPLSGVPIFAVGVGSASASIDREVYGLTIGDARVQGSLVDLSALVVAHGPSAAEVDVTVEEDGRPVDVRHLSLAPGVPRRITARVAPSRETPTVYSVSIGQAEGEITTRNNRQSVLAPPAGEPRRVLVVEGAPAFEHGFLKRTLEEDPGLLVDAVVRKGNNDAGDGTFYVQADASRAAQLTGGFPATKAALFRYDVVVLANVEAGALSADQLAQLQEFVSGRGGGLVVFGARAFESRALSGTPLEDVVPVELVDRAGGLARASSVRDPFSVAITGAGEDHPVMRMGAGPADTRRAWDAAPAVASVAALGNPRPGATLLATTPAPGGVTRPLVAVQRFGRGRSVLFAGEASWRWKMMLPAGDQTYDTFWRQAVRWAGGDAWGPVALGGLASGARVLAAAEVRDENFQAARDARTRLRLVAPSGAEREVSVSWARGGQGRAVGAFETDESGVHQVLLDARRGATDLGAASAYVLVGGMDQEFVHPLRDDGPLRRVVDGTGGRVLGLAEVSQLPEWLRESVRKPEQLAERDLWHTPSVFLVVVALLALEWTLRRRWGLR